MSSTEVQENSISTFTLDEAALSTFLGGIMDRPPYFSKRTKTSIAALKRSLDVAEAIRRMMSTNPSLISDTEVTRAIQNLNALQNLINSNIQDLNSVITARHSPRRVRAEETLRALAQKMAVRFENGYVIIESGPVTIRHNGMSHEMGEFTIYMHHDQAYIKICGTKRKDGHCHPHVGASGNPCYGNIKLLVQQLSQACEFEDLAFLLLDFTKSYSEDNPFKNINLWLDGYCQTCFELRTYCECANASEIYDEEEEEEEEDVYDEEDEDEEYLDDYDDEDEYDEDNSG